MATDKQSAEKEITVEEKLSTLYQLQTMMTEIDKIKTLRGELPLEVQDLEDEIAGLETRLQNYQSEIKDFENAVVEQKHKITESTGLIEKYKAQLDNVRNNREFDNLSKEIEFQGLEIEFSEKKIREFGEAINRKKEEIAELIHVIPQKKETGKKLLVIDDSDQIRWFLKHVFNKEYQILEARNGQDGINVALKEEPDLILCDVMMPVKDGYETCREIKNDPKMAQTPVVMLTAKVESEDVITGIEAGADDYITKPFDVEILRSKINSLMKKRDDMKRYFSNSSAASHNEENTLSTNPFMDAVVKNIVKHLDDSTFEAKVLADSLNMSLPTLYRKIKQYSDLSILELTRNIRLKKAAELLASQQYSVQEVAEMVGFNDTATFRKRFTEQYGVTPSQYGIPA